MSGDGTDDDDELAYSKFTLEMVKLRLFNQDAPTPDRFSYLAEPNYSVLLVGEAYFVDVKSTAKDHSLTMGNKYT